MYLLYHLESNIQVFIEEGHAVPELWPKNYSKPLFPLSGVFLGGLWSLRSDIKSVAHSERIFFVALGAETSNFHAIRTLGI